LVILAFSLPSILFGPLAGVVADRVNRRTLMAIVNVLRGVAVAGFLFIEPGWQVDTVLLAHYIGTFVFGIAGQFFAPAQGATIPSLVPREQLINANALFNLTSTGSQLVGFGALGPVLVQLIGVDMLIAVTIPLFLICAGLVMTIPKSATTPKALAVPGVEVHPMRRVWEEMREGLVYILQDPILMRAIGFLTLASTTLLVVAALGPEFVTGVLGLPKEDIGYIVAPAGFGVLAGVLTVSRISARWSPQVLIDYALVAAGAFLALAATSKDLLTLIWGDALPQWLVVGVTAVLLFLAGVCNAYVLVPAQTLLQERSHETVRARVYASFFMISNTVSFIPIFFTAAFADLFGVVKVLTVVALLLFVLGASSVIHRVTRSRSTNQELDNG
jgi:MFS family permease